MGSGWTAARVSDAVAVTPRGQSDLVAVTARDADPAVAARLSNTYTDIALEQRRRAVAPYVRSEITRLEEFIAERTADADAAQLAEHRDTLRRLSVILTDGDPTLSISSRALPPTSSSAKPAAFVVAVALVVGLVAGLGVAILRSEVAG
jgi:capsular polysaccharide biosynthesis protein